MTSPTPAHGVDAPLDPSAVRKIVLGILLAMFLGALDQTIVATALPTIGRDLADVDNLSWVVTAYLVTATAVTPLYGKLSDIHGRRTMLLLAIAVFSIGSVASALAPTMVVLIIARAFQGLGGGGLLSLAQTVIADVVSPRERGRYQGYIGAVFAASSIGGPVIGGFFAEHLHWSLIFWINLPFGLLALLMSNNVLKRLPRHDRPHQLDFAGAAMIIGATVALLLVLTWGGIRYPWTSAPILVLLTVAAALAALFVIRQLTAREPFLPLSILLNPVVGMGIASGALVFGTMIGLTIFVPMYFEVVRGLTASQSGLALIPQLSGTVVGATVVGRAMRHREHYKRMAVAGLCVAIAGLVVLAIDPNVSLIIVCALTGLVGLGIGMLFPVTTVSIQNAVLPHQLGTTTGAMNFFRSLGGALAVSGFSAIILSSGGGREGLTLAALAAEASQHSVDLSGSFRWLFVAAAGCIAAGLVCLLAMEERPLRGEPAQAPPSDHPLPESLSPPKTASA
ncbi:MAG: MDR family MFS transporter [Xanthobacteraceae bacterium]